MHKAALIQFSMPNLTKGHPAIIFKCSACHAIVEENIRTNIDDYTSALKDVLTCNSCNKQLQYDVQELRNIARYDITSLSEKFQLLPTFIDPKTQNLDELTENDILPQKNEHLTSKKILPFAPKEYQKALDDVILAAIAVHGLLRIIFLGCRSNRIGHIVANTADFLTQLDLDKCLIFGGPEDIIANYNSMTSFWSQQIIFGRWVRDACKLCITPSTKDFVCDIRYKDGFIHLYEVSKSMKLSLNAKDCIEGKRRLGAILKNPQDSYVCFLGRDSLYLEEHYKDKAPVGTFAYHNYRDMDIDAFIPAMKYLSENNITSFRMGSIVTKKLSANNDKNIIDYVSIMHSELMDFYLPMNSKFCVCVASGISLLPTILGKPMLLHLLENLGPGYLYSFGNTFNIYKMLSFKGKHLSLIEIFQKKLNKLSTTESFVAQSVTVEGYTPEDILAATIEMNMRVDGTWVEDDEDKYIQARFKKIISNKLNIPLEKVTTRISTSFCKNHPDFLLGDL